VPQGAWNWGDQQRPPPPAAGGDPRAGRSVDEIVDATFSLSSSTPHLFGARRTDFEAELRALLEAEADDGLFCERVRDIAFDVWRPG